MAKSDNPTMVECPECGAAMFVDASAPDEREEWGDFGAQCGECDTRYKWLQRNVDGKTWTDENGQRFVEV